MKTALLGFTGFVGSQLVADRPYTDAYNSKNISDIVGKHYDLIVSCATSSLKWKANQEPEKDWKAIQELINPLKKVDCDHFILISTIDVYPQPQGVTEDTAIAEKEITQGYGKNRFRLEEFVRSQFKQTTIIRLPQLFGPRLKKNFIYDLIHLNALDFTHKDSMFQWYNVEHLDQDIQIALDNNLSLVNFATEPTRASDVARECAGMSFETITTNPPNNYNFHTMYATLFGSSDGYLYHQKEIFAEIKELIETEKKNL